MSETKVFERLAVVGLGLVGGSVGRGALEFGLAREVRGVDPSLQSAGPIALTSLAQAAHWAEAVVLAVPIGQIEPVVQELSRCLRDDALVTDTASLKVPVAAAARRWLPVPENCVGAHPMAGGDMSGFAHARSDLFQGAACILTPSGNESVETVDRIEQFWQGLGTITVRRTPEEHDAIMAVLSHAPHVVAFAFAQGLPDAGTLGLAGPGLKDFLRIARGNPGLWSEILLRNRQHIAEDIARFKKNLEAILETLGRGDRAALERALQRAQQALHHLDR